MTGHRAPPQKRLSCQLKLSTTPAAEKRITTVSVLWEDFAFSVRLPPASPSRPAAELPAAEPRPPSPTLLLDASTSVAILS